MDKSLRYYDLNTKDIWACPSQRTFVFRLWSVCITDFSNADWVGSPTSRQSTIDNCVFVRENLVLWKSNNQIVVRDLVMNLNIEPWPIPHMTVSR